MQINSQRCFRSLAFFLMPPWSSLDGFEGHLLKRLSTGLVHGRVLWASLAAWETERHDLATCLEREGMSLVNRLATDFVPLKGSLCSSRFSRSESLPQALVGTGFRPPQIDLVGQTHLQMACVMT